MQGHELRHLKANPHTKSHTAARALPHRVGGADSLHVAFVQGVFNCHFPLPVAAPKVCSHVPSHKAGGIQFAGAICWPFADPKGLQPGRHANRRHCLADPQRTQVLGCSGQQAALVGTADGVNAKNLMGGVSPPVQTKPSSHGRDTQTACVNIANRQQEVSVGRVCAGQIALPNIKRRQHPLMLLHLRFLAQFPLRSGLCG